VAWVYPSLFFSGISPKKLNGKWESGYGQRQRRGRPGDEKEAGKIAELGSGKHLNRLRISPS
jgi:hypothetical protein